MGRACSQMEEGRSAFKILTGKPRGKKPLGKPRHRQEDNIEIDFEEIDVNLTIMDETAYWDV